MNFLLGKTRELKEVGERLHLAYYLYLNRKVKSEVKGQEKQANGHERIFLERKITTFSSES